MNILQVSDLLLQSLNAAPSLHPPVEFTYTKSAMKNLTKAGFTANSETLEVGYGVGGSPLEAELESLQNKLRAEASVYTLAEIAAMLGGEIGAQITNLSTWRRGTTSLSPETILVLAEKMGVPVPKYTIRPFSFSYP